MIAMPRATRSRSTSGLTPSTAATYFISSVILPCFACSICVIGLDSSVRRLGRPQLADDRDLDPTGVFHLGLDFPRQLRREQRQMIVVDLTRVGDHPDLPTGLDRVGMFHPFHFVGKTLQFLDALHVVDHAFPAGPRP